MRTVYQPDSKDCGPACLCAIARHYGKRCSLQWLRERCAITREGVSMLALAEAAEAMGFSTLSAKITLAQLSECMPLPCVLLWDSHHFVVCYKVSGHRRRIRFHIMDPAKGKVSYSLAEMSRHWISSQFHGEEIGIAMQILPSPAFECDTEDEDENKPGRLSFFLRFLRPHTHTFLLMIAGASVMMLMNYCTPFLAQAMVDQGVMNRNIDLIMLIVVFQLAFALSQGLVQFVQSWISLHMNTAIDVSLVESYLNKLVRLPVHFFEIKTMGDILQRIGDHGRIKNFLMNNVVSSLFSLATFVVFTVVMAVYNWQILCVFLVGNILYVLWIATFLKYRRQIDNKMFAVSSRLQNNMVQFVEGMTEIKLNGMERVKIWEWKHLQAEIYRTSMTGMKIGQIQASGSMLISSVTNIVLSYITARLVVNGSLTLGSMMSLSFILGQIAGPINSVVGFICSYQDAKISLERLNDVNGQKDETVDDERKLAIVDNEGDICLRQVWFSYSGSSHNYALKDVSLTIPHGSFVALVGGSGSGKTTLLRMIQGLYEPQRGSLKVGKVPLTSIRPSVWRAHLCSVMQDGYIFSDTIARNIAVGCDDIDYDVLRQSAARACILDFVDTLPMNFSTKIGCEGIGLSQGQKQRILLARVFYKRPDFILLDEATNSLDTENENLIMNNLHEFHKGKTLIVAAHRLSTVKDADCIFVMEEGQIVEKGTHQQLLDHRGRYYQLVKKQLA